MVYEESVIAIAHEHEWLRHENAILCSGAHPPSEQDHELQGVYCRLSDAKHGWNYTHMLLDITREEVDIRTLGIVHLEYHVEVQDAELEERVEMITDIKQQLLEFQGQAPPEPVEHDEIDVMLGIDED
jgi:hypothetical protein